METTPTENTHNVNDRISFKVTERGREILAAHFAHLINNVPDTHSAIEVRETLQSVADSTVAEDGTVTMQIWEMAHTFGTHMYDGSTQVFEQNSFQFLDQQ